MVTWPTTPTVGRIAGPVGQYNGTGTAKWGRPFKFPACLPGHWPRCCPAYQSRAGSACMSRAPVLALTAAPQEAVCTHCVKVPGRADARTRLGWLVLVLLALHPPDPGSMLPQLLRRASLLFSREPAESTGTSSAPGPCGQPEAARSAAGGQLHIGNPPEGPQGRRPLEARRGTGLLRLAWQCAPLTSLACVSRGQLLQARAQGTLPGSARGHAASRSALSGSCTSRPPRTTRVSAAVPACIFQKRRSWRAALRDSLSRLLMSARCRKTLWSVGPDGVAVPHRPLDRLASDGGTLLVQSTSSVTPVHLVDHDTCRFSSAVSHLRWLRTP